MSRLLRLRRRLADQGGYTLLELLMVLAILGTVTGAITTLFIRATNAEFEMNRRFQAQQSARVAIDKMRREIHCASAITPSGVAASITVTLPAQCPSSGGSQVNGVSLGKLTVTLPINTKPTDASKQWKVVADMVLRNTTR